MHRIKEELTDRRRLTIAKINRLVLWGSPSRAFDGLVNKASGIRGHGETLSQPRGGR